MAAYAGDNMDLTQAAEILKYKYLPAVADAFNNETILMNRLERKKAVVQGARYVFGVHATRNWSTGPRPETGVAGVSGDAATAVAYLPDPGAQTYDQAYLQRSHWYGRIKVTGPALSAGKGDGALIDILGREMSGIKKDLVKSVNRGLFGKSYGALCTVVSASTTTITCDTTVRLEVGMPVTFAVTAASATGERGSAVSTTVSSITSDTVFVVADDPSADNTFSVYPYGLTSTVTTQSSGAYGCDGLGHIVNSTSGSYADIARTNTYWAAERVDGSAGLSVDLMMDTVARMRKNAGGKCSLIVTSDKQWRAYGNLIDPSRRWAGTIKKLDGGFDSLELNGTPIVWDPDCDHNVMYFLDESTFKILEEEPLGFMDRDGSVLVRCGSGASAEDAYEGTLIWRGTLMCNNPHANAAIYDLPS